MMTKKTRNLLIGVVVLLAVLLTAFAMFEMAAAAGQAGNQMKMQLGQGQKLYMQYCASCHGTDATGKGPVAIALRVPPTDLTRISKENGKFPIEKLQASISGENALPVHGNRDMPVWGGTLNRNQIALLVKYIESIQKPFSI